MKDVTGKRTVSLNLPVVAGCAANMEFNVTLVSVDVDDARKEAREFAKWLSANVYGAFFDDLLNEMKRLKNL